LLTTTGNNERLDESKGRCHRSLVSSRMILDHINSDHPDNFVSMRFALSTSPAANKKRISDAFSDRVFALLHGSQFNRPFPNCLVVSVNFAVASLFLRDVLFRRPMVSSPLAFSTYEASSAKSFGALVYHLLYSSGMGFSVSRLFAVVSTIMNKSIPSATFLDFSKSREIMMRFCLPPWAEKESALDLCARRQRRSQRRRTARKQNR
jgi:hypothetical protein